MKHRNSALKYPDKLQYILSSSSNPQPATHAREDTLSPDETVKGKLTDYTISLCMS